jgi:aryl-alcohol dehydrogenase-like predicted oxidoreductase
MLTECESRGIGFVPYRPLRAWQDASELEVLTRAASWHNAQRNQVALAWLLAISPVTLPIPGTATRAHLEANVAAAALQLDRDEIDAISAAVGRPESDRDAAALSSGRWEAPVPPIEPVGPERVRARGRPSASS